MNKKIAESILVLAGIQYGTLLPSEGDMFVYGLNDQEGEIIAYIVSWEHDDGVVTYTIYDDLDGNFIKDIAIIPFNYKIKKT